EPAVGAAGNPRNFTIGVLRHRIMAFLEREDRNPDETKFARGFAEIVDLLFHGVADEDQRLHRRIGVLLPRVAQHLANLRVAAAAIDPPHELGEPDAGAYPCRSAALVKTAEVYELDVEPAEARRFAKHVRLQGTGHIPGRLTAHGCIERENKPAAPTRGRSRAQRAHLIEKGGYLGLRGGCRRLILAHWTHVIAESGAFRSRLQAPPSRGRPGKLLLALARSSNKAADRRMAERPRVARTIPVLRRAIAGYRRAGATVALVPTMGALHEGHLALVRAARARARRVVVSIFVNPTQFAPHEDFATYPRRFAADLQALAALRVDLIWAPAAKVMYPEGFATGIAPGGAAKVGLEDKFRPHFFGGVATVVAKLFMQTTPDVALFGQKDYQQLRVITQMARDLDLPLR